MTIDKKVVQQILKEELLVFKVNKTIIQEHKKLVSKRQDFNSLVLKEILYKKYGKDFDIYRLDEGLWDKVKNMVAVGGNKLGKFFKMGKSDTQKDMDNKELNTLISKAGAALPAGLIKQLTQPDPDGERFPNQESGEAFASRLEAIQFAYGAIVAALEAGTLPHESAEAAILALRRFLLNSMDKMSRVYKTFNEEEENSDEVLEEDLLSERNYRKLAADVARIARDDGPDAGREAANKLIRMIKDTPPNWRRKAKIDALDSVMRFTKATTPSAAAAAGAAGTTKAAAGAAGAGTTAAQFGGSAMTAAKGALGGGASASKVGASGMAAAKAALGGGGGAAKVAATAKAVPGLAGLLATLGISPAMAAAGAITVAGGALIGGLYLKGMISSRGASIKRLIKTMEVPPATAQTNVVPEPGEPLPAPTSEPSGRGDVYVFRGKGGKGIQSQLAKAGISGKDMSRMLKALKKDLSAAGFNVLEEAKRETISLENTLAALEQIADVAQKEAAKKALVQLLRGNKVRIDPESSKALQADDLILPEPEEAPEAAKPAVDKKDAPSAKAPPTPAKAKKPSPPPWTGGETVDAKTPSAADDEEKEKKPKYKKRSSQPLDFGAIDEGIDRKEQVIIERWQVIAGIDKKVL